MFTVDEPMGEPNTFDPLLDSLVASAEDGSIGFWLIVNVVQAVQSRLACSWPERSIVSSRPGTSPPTML